MKREAKDTSSARNESAAPPVATVGKQSPYNPGEKQMSVSDETTTVSDGILLSDAAAAKVQGLLEQEGRDDLALRVAVQPGGCSGLRYQLFFDERSLDGDVVKEFGSVKVVTDRMSAPYLGGASIDFVDTIEKQGFHDRQPERDGFLRLRRLLQLSLLLAFDG